MERFLTRPSRREKNCLESWMNIYQAKRRNIILYIYIELPTLFKFANGSTILASIYNINAINVNIQGATMAQVQDLKSGFCPQIPHRFRIRTHT